MGSQKTRQKESVRYPWDTWLARVGTFRLRRNEDFDCATHGMAIQIRTAAWNRKMRVSVLTEGDTLIVRVVERKEPF
jgi:hypothetical protein